MWGVACLPPYTEYKPQPMRDLVEIWADFPAFKERDTDGLLDAIIFYLRPQLSNK